MAQTIKWAKTEAARFLRTVTRSKCGRFVIVRKQYSLPAASVAYIVYYAKAGKVCRFHEARLVDAKEAIEDMIEDGEVFDCLPTDLKL
ncbi:hypothetical protein [Sulfurimonas sp.]|uniref:hypothetical protein n=1 Tax=Sulfurimonas sp. TaxID=2022749 RepID=UPI0025E04340|nr:hypothetical protein [Sulfurimonas sp.]MCK9474098.1 hypothetical protein [Sulfurimonas sp.]